MLAAAGMLWLFALSVGYTAALSMAAASLAFSAMSVIVAARRLYFLAGASPHSALLAATIAIPLAYSVGGDPYLYAVPLSVLLVYIAGYIIYRGVDPDIATSILVALSASGSVTAVYYVKTAFPVSYDVSAIVFGDPLLVTKRETYMAVATAVLALALTLLTYVENVYLGVDRDSARITGLRVWLYDLLFFTLLGVVVAVMVKVVGFILEHVFMLLPGAAASVSAGSARRALLLSLVLSFTAMGLGAGLSLATGLSPSGASGFAMLGLYVVAVLAGRGRQ
ncbi:metal ABC transporter permease [Hyperthermus butylicus]|uniref:metal ABC transporter permease n=1 Tax=Hyperthermus butylicus TaxID=54248 RepID=UPI001E33102B|nr:metal ABC transporter permease [Hyperthermus butylicus]